MENKNVKLIKFNFNSIEFKNIKLNKKPYYHYDSADYVEEEN